MPEASRGRSLTNINERYAAMHGKGGGKGGGYKREGVVVVVDATEDELNLEGLDWALLNVVESGRNELMVLGVLQENQPYTYALVWELFKSLSCCSPRTSRVRLLEEKVSRKMDAFNARLEESVLLQQKVGTKVHVRVTAGSGPLHTLVLQDTATLAASWVIIDRNLKAHCRFLSEQLSCNVVLVKGKSEAEVLRIHQDQLDGKSPASLDDMSLDSILLADISRAILTREREEHMHYADAYGEVPPEGTPEAPAAPKSVAWRLQHQQGPAPFHPKRPTFASPDVRTPAREFYSGSFSQSSSADPSVDAPWLEPASHGAAANTTANSTTNNKANESHTSTATTTLAEDEDSDNDRSYATPSPADARAGANSRSLTHAVRNRLMHASPRVSEEPPAAAAAAPPAAVAPTAQHAPRAPAAPPSASVADDDDHAGGGYSSDSSSSSSSSSNQSDLESQTDLESHHGGHTPRGLSNILQDQRSNILQDQRTRFGLKHNTVSTFTVEDEPPSPSHSLSVPSSSNLAPDMPEVRPPPRPPRHTTASSASPSPQSQISSSSFRSVHSISSQAAKRQQHQQLQPPGVVRMTPSSRQSSVSPAVPPPAGRFYDHHRARSLSTVSSVRSNSPAMSIGSMSVGSVASPASSQSFSDQLSSSGDTPARSVQSHRSFARAGGGFGGRTDHRELLSPPVGWSVSTRVD